MFHLSALNIAFDDFVDPLSHEYTCPITMELDLEPYQTLCCGNYGYRATHDKIVTSKMCCPMCLVSKPKIILDKAHLRRVLAMKVKCWKRDSGCTWTGEVGGELVEHVNKKCKYAGKGITAVAKLVLWLVQTG